VDGNQLSYTFGKQGGWKMNPILASLSCALLFSAPALSQVSSSLSTGPDGVHGTMHFQAAFYHGAAIMDAPYSAETVDEHVQTLADGTRISQTFPEKKIYRDSMGRTREEHHVFMGPVERHPNLSKSPIVVEINDPVAHFRYVFILSEPVVHRQESPDSPRRASDFGHTGHAVMSVTTGVVAVAGRSGETEAPTASPVRASAPSAAGRHGVDDPNHPQIITEDLGAQIIEGVQAEGKKHTTTWPVGTMGNDRPIVSTSEIWTSPELKEIILRKSDDPRSGEQTYKLVDINRSEPDPSLFEPPPGYTVKDETGEFKIDWVAPR
jgi:hypothetical protein